MKIFLTVILVLFVAAIQVTVFGQWRPFGVMPNLMLILVICLALWGSATVALAGTIIGGLTLDLASGTDFGLRTAFYTVVALTVIAAKQLGLHADSMLSAVVLVMLSTLLFDIAVLSTIPRMEMNWPYIVSKTGWQITVNSSIMLIVYGGRVLLTDRRTRINTELKRKSWL